MPSNPLPKGINRDLLHLNALFQVVERMPDYLLNDTWWQERVEIMDVVADGLASGVSAVNTINEIINGDYNSAIQQLTAALSTSFTHVEELQQ